MTECPWFHLAAGPHTTVGIRPFVLGGELRIGVIVKLALELPHPIARVVSPPPIELDDRYAASRGVGSIVAASDLALRKPACDITMTGVARTPGGQPAQTLPVRLSMFRGNTPILRKAVVANGPVGEGGNVQPITAMPLTYERAFGGPEWTVNPVGSMTPSVRMAHDPSAPACFAPRPGAWAIRRQTLEASVRQELGTEVPSLESPFPWEYFQSAPPDQVVSHLAGGEWLLIDGISGTWPRIQTQLPTLDAKAFLVTRNAIQPIKLSWDTLAIEGESLRAAAVFRGDVASPVPLSLTREVAIVVRLGGGDLVDLRDAGELFDSRNLVRALTREPGAPLDTTKGLSVTDHQSASKKPIAPYAIGERAEPAKVEASTPGAPWSATPVASVVPAAARNVTMPLRADDLRAPETPTAAHFVANAGLASTKDVPAPPAIVSAPLREDSPIHAPPMAVRPSVPEKAAVGMPSFLLGVPNGHRPAPRVAPDSSNVAPAVVAAPERVVSSDSLGKIASPIKPPSPIELAAAALRKSGMSEERLAEVLRGLQRELGSE